MQKVRKALSNKFPVKNLGAAKNILGMRVERSNNVITLDQSNYIRMSWMGSTCKTVNPPALF
jgi:hypothetical protein